jgi:hypothetical protein
MSILLLIKWLSEDWESVRSYLERKDLKSEDSDTSKIFARVLCLAQSFSVIKKVLIEGWIERDLRPVKGVFSRKVGRRESVISVFKINNTEKERCFWLA